MPTSDPSDARPDPDLLLARAKRDEKAAARGKLRIYFGASAGVGKTYAMLVAGRRLARDGVDVVIGVIETHGRRETAALLGDDETLGPSLASIPRWRPVVGNDRAADEAPPTDDRRADEAAASIASTIRADDGDDTPGGTGFDEFDLDATIARRPQLVLVDELAHSNVAGVRHPKRWQDVDELLTSGIDVFTTLNVQHLESLNDVVSGITGIKVWETVPDTFFDRADEVILVDIPADELLKRLAAGKVYVPEQAAHAARNFFRKGNLIALREIALRRTADRVEGDVQAYREERSIEKVWGTEAALLCCIGPDAGAERVVRSAARLAGQLDVAWHAVYVETPRLQMRSNAQRENILRIVRLAQQLGATTTVLSGSDVADAVTRYAREHNLSRIVVGHGFRVGAARLIGAKTLNETIGEHAPELDLLVVGSRSIRDEADSRRGPPTTLSKGLVGDASGEEFDRRKRRAVQLRYFYALLTCGLLTAVAQPFWLILHPTNIAMVYLLAVTLIAMRFGRGPAVFASFVSVAAFDFFFVPPRFSFAVADVQFVVTFGVMLTVALVIGTLAANLRYQARVARHREHRARSLYEIARDLSKALRTENVVVHARSVIESLFDAEVRVLLPARITDETPGIDRLEIDQALGRSSGFEPAIAQWAYQHSLPAGIGTDTLSGSAWLFLPLQTPIRARGVLAIRPARRRLLLIPEQRRLLETLAALVAIAIERVHYVEVAQSAVLRVESERLRNSILSALSHDLRTPIAALAMSIETLAMSHADPMSSSPDSELIAAMQTDVHRMSALVENLLDMARIESGDVTLRRHWHAIEETIGSAVAASRHELAQHVLRTDVPTRLPLVEYDAVLIERVLCNLIENAAKYSPAGSTILIEAHAATTTLSFALEDDGGGVGEDFMQPDRMDSLFDKFTRGARESPTSGVGLGLAICRAIVEAHGGTIAMDPARHLASRPGRRGFRVVVTLPRTDPPAVDEWISDHVAEDATDRPVTVNA